MTLKEKVIFMEADLVRQKKTIELLEKSVEGLWNLMKTQCRINDEIMELFGVKND